MSALEAVQPVQYVTVKEKRFAVIDVDEGAGLIAWLESLEDLHAFQAAYKELETAAGSRERAGWLRWEDVQCTIEE